jgi:hypothetical protein
MVSGTRSLRADVEPELHKRIRQAAVDLDMTTAGLVRLAFERLITDIERGAYRTATASPTASSRV